VVSPANAKFSKDAELEEAIHLYGAGGLGLVASNGSGGIEYRVSSNLSRFFKLTKG
jgi:hypothetical protein